MIVFIYNNSFELFFQYFVLISVIRGLFYFFSAEILQPIDNNLSTTFS